jgi:hypothetical protein
LELEEIVKKVLGKIFGVNSKNFGVRRKSEKSVGKYFWCE